MTTNKKEQIEEKLQSLMVSFNNIDNQIKIQEKNIMALSLSNGLSIEDINQQLLYDLKSNRTAIEILRDEIEELQIILIELFQGK